MAKAEKIEEIELSLRGEFKGVTVKRSETGALTFDVSALDGVDVTVITNGNGRVMKLAPAEEQTNKPDVINASVDSRSYNIGDVLPDGWIVGPVSPTTGKPISMEPETGALDGYQTWYTGEGHASELREQGHVNARQPDDDELNAIYNDVVVAGRNDDSKLNTSGSLPYGNCWSSTPHPHDSFNARIQYLDDGTRTWSFKGIANARVRCVRDETELSLA